jgi:hypothetical protein
MSNYHVLEKDQTQTKQWATTYETGTGSYSYHTIGDECDELEDLLKIIDNTKVKDYDAIRHISGLWFEARKTKSGKYNLILRQS